MFIFLYSYLDSYFIFFIIEWINELISRRYLVVVSLTVCQALALIMPMTKKWFLTFSTHEMLQTRRWQMIINVKIPHLIRAFRGSVITLPLWWTQNSMCYGWNTSTCHCLPMALTTRPSMGLLQAPQIGTPSLSWHGRQYSSPLSSLASAVSSLLKAESLNPELQKHAMGSTSYSYLTVRKRGTSLCLHMSKYYLKGT